MTAFTDKNIGDENDDDENLHQIYVPNTVKSPKFGWLSLSEIRKLTLRKWAIVLLVTE